MSEHVDILTDLRSGLEAKEFTLRDVEEWSEIPYTTLREMIRPDWQKKTFDRLTELQAALKRKSKQKEPEVAK